MTNSATQGRPVRRDDPAFVAWFERQKADYLWCLQQPDILNRYAGQVVVVYNRAVLGHGRDDLEALEDARRGATQQGEPLPGSAELLFVPIPEPLPAGYISLPLASAPSLDVTNGNS